MDKIIGVCGITCTDCPAYKATRADDDAEREKVAETWSKEFNAELKPEDINCDGCTALEGKHFGYCGQCEIRACGLGKEVDNCAHCSDYACEKLGKFFEMVPQARETLDGIKAGLDA
jgi:hypothetical protein